MKIKYEVEDGTLFDNQEQAEKYEEFSKNRVTVEVVTKRKISLISPDNLKNIFALGEVSHMTFYLKKEDGTVYCDGSYETHFLDKTGHLDCSDYEHGLLEWSEKDSSYYRTYCGCSWKVELLGIEHVSYS